jgi:hypothetical protein
VTVGLRWGRAGDGEDHAGTIERCWSQRHAQLASGTGAGRAAPGVGGAGRVRTRVKAVRRVMAVQIFCEVRGDPTGTWEKTRAAV